MSTYTFQRNHHPYAKTEDRRKMRGNFAYTKNQDRRLSVHKNQDRRLSVEIKHTQNSRTDV